MMLLLFACLASALTVNHYGKYIQKGSFMNVFVIFDECSFYDDTSYSRINYNGSFVVKKYSKQDTSCSGSFQEVILDLDQEIVNGSFANIIQELDTTTLIGRRAPNESCYEPGLSSFYYTFTTQCFVCGSYHCKHEVITIDGVTGYYNKKYYSNDCSKYPFSKELIVPCGYSNNGTSYGYSTYCKVSSLLTYTKKKTFEKVSVILEECIYYNPKSSYGRIHKKVNGFTIDLYGKEDSTCSGEHQEVVITMGGEMIPNTIKVIHEPFDGSRMRSHSYDPKTNKPYRYIQYITHCFTEGQDRIHAITQSKGVKGMYLLTFDSSNGTCNNNIKTYTLLEKCGVDEETGVETNCNIHLVHYNDTEYRKIYHILDDCTFYNQNNYAISSYNSETKKIIATLYGKDKQCNSKPIKSEEVSMTNKGNIVENDGYIDLEKLQGRIQPLGGTDIYTYSAIYYYFSTECFTIDGVNGSFRHDVVSGNNNSFYLSHFTGTKCEELIQSNIIDTCQYSEKNTDYAYFIDCNLTHYYSIKNEATRLEYYVILDKCIFLNDFNYNARIKPLSDGLFKIYTFLPSDTECKGEYRTTEINYNTFIPKGNLSSGYEKFDSSRFFGRNKPTTKCDANVNSGLYYAVDKECFIQGGVDNAFVQTTQDNVNGLYRLQFESKNGSCTGNYQVTSLMKKCGCVTETFGYSVYNDCTDHYFSFTERRSYQTIYIIHDKCVFYNNTYAIITTAGDEFMKFTITTYDNPQCNGVYISIRNESYVTFMVQNTAKEGFGYIDKFQFEIHITPKEGASIIIPSGIYMDIITTCYEVNNTDYSATTSTTNGVTSFYIIEYKSSGKKCLGQHNTTKIMDCGLYYDNGTYYYVNCGQSHHYISYLYKDNGQHEYLILDECVGGIAQGYSIIKLNNERKEIIITAYHDSRCTKVKFEQAIPFSFFCVVNTLQERNGYLEINSFAKRMMLGKCEDTSFVSALYFDVNYECLKDNESGLYFKNELRTFDGVSGLFAVYYNDNECSSQPLYHQLDYECGCNFKNLSIGITTIHVSCPSTHYLHFRQKKTLYDTYMLLDTCTYFNETYNAIVSYENQDLKILMYAHNDTVCSETLSHVDDFDISTLLADGLEEEDAFLDMTMFTSVLKSQNSDLPSVLNHVIEKKCFYYMGNDYKYVQKVEGETKGYTLVKYKSTTKSCKEVLEESDILSQCGTYSVSLENGTLAYNLQTECDIYHYLHYYDKKTCLENYLLLDKCVFYNNTYYSIFTYDGSTVTYTTYTNSNCQRSVDKNIEFSMDDTENVEEKTAYLDLEQLKIHSIMGSIKTSSIISFKYTTFNDQCFVCNGKYSRHIYDKGNTSMVSLHIYENSNDCQEMKNEIATEKVISCGLQTTKERSIVVQCDSEHYIEYYDQETYRNVTLILDKCVYYKTNKSGDLNYVKVNYDKGSITFDYYVNDPLCMSIPQNEEKMIYPLRYSVQEYSNYLDISTLSSSIQSSTKNTDASLLYFDYPSVCFQCGTNYCKYNEQNNRNERYKVLKQYTEATCSNEGNIIKSYKCGDSLISNKDSYYYMHTACSDTIIEENESSGSYKLFIVSIVLILFITI